MNEGEGIIRRKNVTRNNLSSGNETDTTNLQIGELSLMEEVLLLGLKEREGYTSFWNSCISNGLRGCILVELGLRGRIVLENVGLRRISLLSRKIVIKNDTSTEDVLLDEVLKHIKETDPPVTVLNWIEYLNGDTWNPLKLRYRMRNTRERLAKNLVDKGVLTTEKQNFIFFDLTTHPLIDNDIKRRLVKKIQDALLSKWVKDPQKFGERLLALIFLSYASDVLENALVTLNDEDYELASCRARELLDLNFERESSKHNATEVLWAVIAVYFKYFF